VSDTLVQKSGHSGFAWIIVHEMTQLWRGQGLAPGPAEDIHSGCAEAFGILAALTFLSYYLSCYDPLPYETPLTCFCDNIGVITNILSFCVSETSHPNNSTNDDCDLILAINAAINTCQPLEIKLLHMKGHQDTKANHPLTLKEQYNVECNCLAKHYASSSPILSTSLANLPTPPSCNG